MRGGSPAGCGELACDELARTPRLALRSWTLGAGAKSTDSAHVASHESVGYVVSGRAELVMEGQTLQLRPGDSFVVPRGALHSYKCLGSEEEPFRCVEAAGRTA